MNNRAIDRIINNSKKNMYKPVPKEQKDSVRIYINVIIKMCKNILKENPNIRGNQLYDMFYHDIIDICENYCKNANIRGMLFQLEAIKELIGNKDLIISEYERVKNEKSYDENTIYNANISNACANIVHQAVTQIERVETDKKDITKPIIDLVNRYSKADKKNRAILRNQNKNMNLDMLEKALPLIYSDDYSTKIELELKMSKSLIENEIKEKLIKVMEIIGEFFENFDQTEIFNQKNSEKMGEVTKADLRYEKSTNQYDENNIGIKEMFSENFLKNQSLEYLLAYSLFWQNRFAKICKDINIAQFAITDMNLWDEIAKNSKQINISDYEMEAICKKQIVLSEMTAQMISELKREVRSNRVKHEHDGNIIKIYNKEKIERYNKQEGENYKKIFDEINLISENVLKDDLEEYKMFFSQVENIYKIKDGVLGCKIRELFNSKKTKNWGVITEKNNKDKLLIGIDYEGINMPLRLHIDRKLLVDLLKLKKQDTKIPLYDGQNDFINGGKIITSNVLMPIPKRHKISIRNRIADLKGKNTDEVWFLEHLMFLADQKKYPEHLKENGRRPPKRYIDIDTGDIFIKESTTFTKTQEKHEWVGNCDGR